MGRIVRRLRSQFGLRRTHSSSPFLDGFWQGMAAPVMLYKPPSQQSIYQGANDRIANAWARVGKHMWAAMGDLDRETGRRHD